MGMVVHHVYKLRGSLKMPVLCPQGHRIDKDTKATAACNLVLGPGLQGIDKLVHQ
jgi:hypothetical protein